MPVITVEGRPIKEIEKKRELVKALTDAAVKTYGLPRETIVILIKENQPQNISVGGRLVIER